MKRIIKHGEVLFKEKQVKGVEIKIEKDFIVVGESETHGNDHRVAVKDKDKIKIFEDENRILYIKNVIDTEIFCPKKGRHDTIILPAGEWELGKAKEYDYVNKQVREVRD